jgi:hypothetical protein
MKLLLLTFFAAELALVGQICSQYATTPIWKGWCIPFPAAPIQST